MEPPMTPGAQKFQNFMEQSMEGVFPTEGMNPDPEDIPPAGDPQVERSVSIDEHYIMNFNLHEEKDAYLYSNVYKRIHKLMNAKRALLIDKQKLINSDKGTIMAHLEWIEWCVDVKHLNTGESHVERESDLKEELKTLRSKFDEQ